MSINVKFAIFRFYSLENIAKKRFSLCSFLEEEISNRYVENSETSEEEDEGMNRYKERTANQTGNAVANYSKKDNQTGENGAVGGAHAQATTSTANPPPPAHSN